MNVRWTVFTTVAFGATGLAMACSDSGTTSTAPLTTANSGTMVVRLTDAPFLTDSVKRVDIFVMRVDARSTDATDDDANKDLDEQQSESDGWKAVASPNASFDLMSLQNGVATTLGQANLAAGSYSGFRFIIDQSKSSVALKSGLVLTGSSSPGIKFPSADKSGIKIVLDKPVVIVSGSTTTFLVDFNVNDSFVIRGNTIAQNGLLFKPVIHASITNLALTNANVRLINATGVGLTLLQNGTALTGSSNIAFGTSSACSSVNAATPLLTVIQVGSTTPLTGFAPTLAAGQSFSIVAYPTAAGGAAFATLSNAFTPTTAQTGFRVFNATTGTTGFDVYVAATPGPLGTPTVANVLAGTASTFMSLPAGTMSVRLATAGGTTVLLDVGSQTFTAGQDLTLVIAPPANGSTVPRAFLAAGC